MASIGSLTGSTSSGSIYGNRNSNIISGLASGLDTESMIEGMVQGYQQKISGLEQNRTVLQWQQQAYQSISNKLVEFARKYASYTSSTNLLSSSFFNNAVVTTPNGTFSNLVTASGKTSSNVVLNAVAQLATAARYTVNNSLGASAKDGQITVEGEEIDLGKEIQVSTMSGSLTLTYGNQNITLDFGELEDFSGKDGKLDLDKFKEAVEKKLADQKITTSSGNVVSASEVIGVEVGPHGIGFSDKSGAGTSIYISGASGDFKDMVMELEDTISGKSSSIRLDTDKAVTERVSTTEYLRDKPLTITLNGQTKQIKVGEVTPQNGETYIKAFARTLNESIADAFGAGKITVGTTDANNALTFQVANGNTLSVNSSVNELLGLGENGLTSYLDTSRTLGDLLGEDMKGLTALRGEGLDGGNKPIEKDGKYYDTAGNLVDQDGNRIDSEGNKLYSMKINGVEIGTYTKDTALETVINGINSNTEAGVNVSYSKLTNQFVFTAKETGEGGKIDYGTVDGQGNATDLAAALFGGVTNENAPEYVKGQDAIFQATINGETMTFTRSSNTFEADGMNITFSGTFNAADGVGKDPITSEELKNKKPEDLFKTDGEGVTFTSKTNADTIVDAIKSMVEDYNAIVSEVKKAYSDMPLEQSDGSKYKPLTDKDKEGMTESEIKAYEEKAKTGILFMDRDLSSLYNALRSAVAPGGADGSFLRSIGIKTSYEDGLTTISLDETALREALETNPDQVRDAFTKSKDNGAATDGLMTMIQKVTDRYAATTGDVKGILIEKAGSQYSPTAALDNTLLNQMKEIDEHIEKWQDKMSNKVDYYTNKFTQLEVLIQQMNSQSSTLSGLMGGY